jgi:hypothetical protein
LALCVVLKLAQLRSSNSVLLASARRCCLSRRVISDSAGFRLSKSGAGARGFRAADRAFVVARPVCTSGILPSPASRFEPDNRATRQADARPALTRDVKSGRQIRAGFGGDDALTLNVTSRQFLPLLNLYHAARGLTRLYPVAMMSVYSILFSWLKPGSAALGAEDQER